MKIQFGLSVAALIVWAISIDAFACSCVKATGSEEEQVASALREATEVFVARVEFVKHSPAFGDTSGNPVIEDAVFVVVETLKGRKLQGTKVAIRTTVSPGSCGRSARNDPPWVVDLPEDAAREGQSVAAKVSDTWLIFAYGAEPYDLSSCSRSAPLDVGGQEDLDLIRRLFSQLR